MINNAQKEAMLKEVIEARGEFLMEQMRDMAEHGPPIPGRKGAPPERLRQYMKDTLPQELEMVLDPEYPQKLMAGAAPEPAPAVWYGLLQGRQVLGPFLTPDEAAQASMMAGLPPNPDGTPPIEQKHNFWWLLAQLPLNWSWTPMAYHSRDFKNLLEQLGQRMENAT